ncbi:hypothetical protein PspLS_10422 [Pyricularia sp. CBS 133598]|nr:hypothetical protein PspLS_10422 [Pyricularia sp. CBS 133598]
MADETDPIAIVGMAVRLPGGISNTSDFWDMLVNKQSGLIPIPSSRFNLDGFYSAAPRSQSIRNREAYMFDPKHVNLDAFDASHFTPGEKEISAMDPMQRQLLEVARECLDSAGEKSWRGRKIGCYVGTFSSDYQDDLSMDPHHNGIYRGSGYLDFLQPNRISYEYDWTGPSMLVKTGCSSSMVALHLAAEAVRTGAAESAMALGANLMMSVMTSVIFTETGVLSPSGKCKTFDLLADGYGRGEAVNAVYVKRLSHALRDGNPIRAIIKSSATNNDGRSNGIMSPNTDQQEALIRATYAQVGLPFEETAFFECHVPWNAAKLSVPREVTEWPADKAERVSVNSFGVAGSNAHMILESAERWLQDSKPELPTGHERKDSGVGLGNLAPALLLFSAAHPKGVERQMENHKNYLLSKKVLDSDVVSDVAYTLAHHREKMGYRGYSMVDVNNGTYDVGSLTLLQQSERPSAPPNRRLVFVFTGQGAQWAQMGTELLQAGDAASQIFSECIAKLDKFISSLPAPYAADWSIAEEIAKDKSTSRVSKRGFSHPCATAVQIALVDLLASLGLHPEAVIGHSGGEATAAYASGSISAEAAMAVAYFRGWVLQHANDEEVGVPIPAGSMAAVGMGRREVGPYLIPGVVVGCENSQVSCTLSGDPVCIQHCVDQIRRRHPDVSATILDVETSFHSPWIEPLAVPYIDILKPYVADAKPPRIPYFSSVSGALLGESNKCDAEYWRQNFVQPVLFDTAMRQLLDAGASNLFLEVGPHPSLQKPVADVLRTRPEAQSASSYIGTLRRGENAQRSMLKLGGELFVSHAAGVDLTKLIPRREYGKVLADLPSYPWLYENKYSHPPLTASRFKHRANRRHDLLGARVLEGNDIEPAWRNMLDIKEVPWMRDHVVDGQVVFPAACYISMVGEAVRQVSGKGSTVSSNDGTGGAYTVRNMTLTTGLVIPNKIKVELYTRLIPATAAEVIGNNSTDAEAEAGSWYNFRIMSCSDGKHWLSHCSGFVRFGTDESQCLVKPEQADADYPREVDAETWYRRAQALGIEWKTAFQGLDLITAGTVASEAAATVYDYADDEGGPYAAHPIVLDQLLQINLVAMANGLPRKVDKLMLPTFIGRLAVHREQDMRMRIYGSVVTADNDNANIKGGRKLSARAAMFRDDGVPIVDMDGLDFAELPVASKRDTDMKLKDGRLLLGSYFTWDSDITLAESLSPVTVGQAQSEQWKDLHVQELQRAISLIGYKIPDARVLELVEGESPEPSHAVTRLALEALHPSEDVRYYWNYTLAVAAENAAPRYDASLLQSVPGAGEISVVALDEVSLSGPVDVVMIPFKVLTSDDFMVQTEVEALHQQVQAGGLMLVHHLEELDGEQFDDVGARMELASLRLEELSFKLVFQTGSGIILAKPVGETPAIVAVTLLTRTPDSALVCEIKSLYETVGTTVNIVTWNGTIPTDTPKENHLVVSLIDLEDSPVVHQLQSDTFKPFIESLCDLQSPMIWVFPQAHGSVTKPEAAMIQGLVRTVSMEDRALDITLLEAASGAPASSMASGIRKVAESLVDRRKGGSTGLDADRDYAIQADGTIHISRMKWFPLPEHTSETSMVIRFRDDAAYLLAGGMGGLGRAVATWMAERGARHFVFLSRSAADPRNEPFVEELRSYPGGSVVTISGDVGNIADVKAAVAQSPVPIAGVLQLSLALRDAVTREMSFADWETCVRPRVQGTLNLHEELLETPLDFFLIFGSGGGHTGYYGQANYSAANSFLDAFADHRRAAGLPASIIDLGVVGDVGYVVDSEQVQQSFVTGGFFFLTETDVLDAVALALQDSSGMSSFCLGGVSSKSIMDPTNKVNWKRDVRFGIARHMKNSSSRSSSDDPNSVGEAGQAKDQAGLAVVEQIRANGATPENVALAAGALAGALSQLMLRPVFDFPLTESLTSIGLDSIISIELVDWIHNQFGVGMTSMGVTQSTSLMHLGQKVADLIVAQC